MNQFRTTRGRLTAYAFGCGYLEKRTQGTCETVLWREHGVYHVRQVSDGRRVFWQTFRQLGTARRLFNQQPGVLS